MKRILSKIVISLLLVILVFNYIFTNKVFAGTAEEVINFITNVIGGIVSIVYWPKRIMITGVALIASGVSTMIASMDGTTEPIGFVSAFDVFFNRCTILDVNFFEIDGLLTTSATYKLRNSVAQWFYIMRLIASVILLLILIYVGIRMAISTVAEDKARYKKMLFDWACSLGLIFILQYIAIFTIAANSAIVTALEAVASTQDGFEEAINGIALTAVTGIGINSLSATAVYALIVFQTLGFIIAYFNRMIKIAFLLIISPLIAITYSIDKMGDGKSQAVNNWLKEFIYTILIQPFHCVIFITFISVAFKLLVNPGTSGLIATLEYNQLANGILAILCIKFIKDAEEMVRKIFGFKDDNKGTSLAAGLVASTYAISKAKDIGKGARGMINSAKNNNLFKAAAQDGKNLNLMNKFKDTKFGGKLADAGKNISTKTGKAMESANKKIAQQLDKVKDKIPSKTINGAKTLGGKASDKLGKFSRKVKDGWNSKPVRFLRRHNSLSSALGIAAGLASYAGGSNALQAIGTGSAVGKSADAFLSSSAGTLGKQNSDNLGEIVKDKEAQKAEKEASIAKHVKDHEEEQKEYAANAKELDGINQNLEETNEDIEEATDDLDHSEENSSDEENSKDSSESSSSTSEESEESEESAEESSEESEESSSESSESKSGASQEKPKTKREELLERKAILENRQAEIETNQEYREEEIETLLKEKQVLEEEIEMLQTEEGMAYYFESLSRNGELGEYSKDKSGRYEEILREIEIALEKVGKDSQMDEIVSYIEKVTKANPQSLDLDQALQRVLGDSIKNQEPDNYEQLISAARELKIFENESSLYQNTKLGNDMNVTTEKIAKSTFGSYIKSKHESEGKVIEKDVKVEDN